MKKILSLIAVGIAICALLAGCGSQKSEQQASSFDTASSISVVSREDGSGTRGAFIELTGVQEKDASGNKVDKTTSNAIIANRTDVMLTQVQGDSYAIGYVSAGSLNDTVKALNVNGVKATTENIKNGSYALVRPFNIATKGEPSELAADFISYILSADGQTVITDNKYTSIDETAAPYSGSKPAGKIVVAGSSSVTPVMEKLKEAYLLVNPNAEIEIQQSDSSAGMQATMDGICDIGMASRELKDSESSLTATSIALDGIAIIANTANPISDISTDTIKSIFTGATTTWAEVQ